MQLLGFPELVVICTVTVLVFWGNKIPEAARVLNEAIANFRGGPRSPSHPIPGDDSKHLRRKLGRSDDASRR